MNIDRFNENFNYLKPKSYGLLLNNDPKSHVVNDGEVGDRVRIIFRSFGVNCFCVGRRKTRQWYFSLSMKLVRIFFFFFQVTKREINIFWSMRVMCKSHYQ